MATFSVGSHAIERTGLLTSLAHGPTPEDVMLKSLTKILSRAKYIVLPPRPIFARSEFGREVKVRHSRVAEPTPKEYSSQQVMRTTLEKQVLYDPPMEHSQELRISRGVDCMVFYGVEAYNRLCLISSSCFNRGIAICEITPRSVKVSISSQALARSAKGVQPSLQTVKNWEDLLVKGGKITLLDKHAGIRKNKRFYGCLIRVHTYFRLVVDVFPEQGDWLRALSILICNSMIVSGENRSKTVTSLMNAVECILRPEAKNPLEESIKRLPLRLQVSLYRLRREFTKSDYRPLENCIATMSTFAEPPKPWSGIEGLVERFVKEFTDWLETADVKRILGTVILHGSGGSLFHTRRQGGGSADLHLVVGLHRLSRGVPSPIVDVFGGFSSTTSVEQLLALLSEEKQSQEVFDACDWFLQTPELAEIICLVMSIYPDREPKARTFLLLDYPTQLGGALAGALLRNFLKTRPHCAEVFGGERADITGALRRSDPRDSALSLDSKTSTDPLPWDLCRRIYSPTHKYTPRFAKRAIERIFGPLRLAGSTLRPEELELTLAEAGGVLAPLQMVVRSAPVTQRITKMYSLPFVSTGGPPPVALAPDYQRIVNLVCSQRVTVIKARTGSGKTVLAASIFSSIIQFASIASMLLFAKTCDHYKIPYNIHYSQEKDGVVNFHDDRKSIPCTILTTSSYVKSLGRRFKRSVVVLDEAESRIEDFMVNLASLSQIGNHVLIMSATPEGLRLDHPIHAFEATTNLAVAEIDMSEDDVVRLCNTNTVKVLICCFSEPECRRLAGRIDNSAVLDAYARAAGLLDEVLTHNTILSTNVIRSSVTIPGLDYVVDQNLRYESVHSCIQGFSHLVLFGTSPSDTIQLKGRVGRTKPGTYVRMASKRDAVEYSPECLQILPKLTRYLNKRGTHDLASSVNFPNHILETTSQLLYQKYTDRGLNEGSPFELQIVLEGVATTVARSLARFVLFHLQGFHMRMNQLKGGTDEDKKLVSQYEKFRNEDPITFYNDVLDRLQELKYFSQEFFLQNTWTFGMKSDIKDPLEIKRVRQSLCVSFWKNIYILRGTMMTSVFRKHAVNPRFFEAEGYHLLFGLSYDQNGESLYACSIPVDEKSVECVRQLLLEITEITHPFHGENIPSAKVFEVRRDDVDGKQRKTFQVTRDRVGRNYVYAPSDLRTLLRSLVASVNALAETDVYVSRRGSPQSCTASFPVLNAISYLTAQVPGTWAVGFGDDLIGIGPRSKLEEIITNRECCSLMTKWESTGFSRLESNAFAVFAERFYYLEAKTFGQVFAPKPKGWINLYASTHPSNIMIGTTYSPHSLRHLRHELSEMPDWLTPIEHEEEEVKSRALSRTTLSRNLVLELLRQEACDPTEPLASVDDIRNVVNRLESLFHTTYPSSRGKPVERDSKAIGVSLSVKACRRVATLIENIRSESSVASGGRLRIFGTRRSLTDLRTATPEIRTQLLTEVVYDGL